MNTDKMLELADLIEKADMISMRDVDTITHDSSEYMPEIFVMQMFNMGFYIGEITNTYQQSCGFAGCIAGWSYTITPHDKRKPSAIENVMSLLDLTEKQAYALCVPVDHLRRGEDIGENMYVKGIQYRVGSLEYFLDINLSELTQVMAATVLRDLVKYDNDFWNALLSPNLIRKTWGNVVVQQTDNRKAIRQL